MRCISSSQLLRLGLAGWVFAFAAPSLAGAEEPSRLDDPSRTAPILRAEVDPGQSFCGYRPPDPSIARLQQLIPDRGMDLPLPLGLQAQGGQPDVGTVYTVGHSIILELDPEDLMPANLFDLEGKTIRFTPDDSGYRTEVLPLQWDPDFGTVIHGFPSAQVSLNNLQFPFSGESWDSFFVNAYGNITFGVDQFAIYGEVLRGFASSMIGEIVPIISPLFRELGGKFGFEDDDPDDVRAACAFRRSG